MWLATLERKGVHHPSQETGGRSGLDGRDGVLEQVEREHFGLSIKQMLASVRPTRERIDKDIVNGETNLVVVRGFGWASDVRIWLTLKTIWGAELVIERAKKKRCKFAAEQSCALGWTMVLVLQETLGALEKWRTRERVFLETVHLETSQHPFARKHRKQHLK